MGDKVMERMERARKLMAEARAAVEEVPDATWSAAGLEHLQLPWIHATAGFGTGLESYLRNQRALEERAQEARIKRGGCFVEAE